jgi:hypothetical protein
MGPGVDDLHVPGGAEHRDDEPENLEEAPDEDVGPGVDDDHENGGGDGQAYGPDRGDDDVGVHEGRLAPDLLRRRLLGDAEGERMAGGERGPGDDGQRGAGEGSGVG